MFDLEHTIFITESYFKNAERRENGEWTYSVEHCVNDLKQSAEITAFEFKQTANKSNDSTELVPPATARGGGESIYLILLYGAFAFNLWTEESRRR
jgi:hypothetical protein